MEDERLMVCDRCRKSVPIADIKFMPKANGTRTSLCSACRGLSTVKNTFAEKETKKPALKAEKVQNVPDERIKPRDAGTSAKKEAFVCGRCKYKFKADPHGASNMKCPYCGASDRIAAFRAPTADSLIQDSGSYDY